MAARPSTGYPVLHLHVESEKDNPLRTTKKITTCAPKSARAPTVKFDTPCNCSLCELGPPASLVGIPTWYRTDEVGLD